MGTMRQDLSNPSYRHTAIAQLAPSYASRINAAHTRDNPQATEIMIMTLWYYLMLPLWWLLSPHVECVAEWSHHLSLSMPRVMAPSLTLGLLLPFLGLRAALGHLGHTIATPSHQCASLHPRTSAWLCWTMQRLPPSIPPCVTMRVLCGRISKLQTSDTYSFSMPSSTPLMRLSLH